MENIDKLATALSKCQGEIKNAIKDSENPFFKSKYADLTSVWNAAREPLKNNELAVMQIPDTVEGNLVLRTILMHSSGQTIEGMMPLTTTEKTTPQQLGSMITYLKRYSLAAMVGVATEDDDGNAANETTIKSPLKKWAESGPGDYDKMKIDVIDLVRKIEMCESIDELNKLVQTNASFQANLVSNLPDWASRLQTKIDQCREAFELA